LGGPGDAEYIGSIFHFYINGVQADETDTFTNAKIGESITGFDLHITALPTPTPTPTMTPTPTAIPISSNGNGVIGTSGGTVNTSDGTITITFPGGAFNASTNVSIQGGTCQGNSSGGFVIGGTCFNVTPDGALSANATICVNLSVSDLSIALSQKSDPTLGYWFNNSWVEASNVTFNITSGILCGQTSHLSHWAVLIPTVNGTPAATPTPSITPTSAATPTPSITPTSTTSPTTTPTHTPSQTNGGGTNWALIGGIAGGVVLLAVIIIAINSRRRGGGKISRPRSSRKAKPKK
jgi:hypothetical protein